MASDGEQQMSELIQQYLSEKTEENKAKLVRYMKQHKMAALFATEKELKVLRKLGLN